MGPRLIRNFVRDARNQLALLCVGALVWFVHHVAPSIDVETVVGAVHAELIAAIGDDTLGEAPSLPPSELLRGEAVPASGGGSLQAVDGKALADWTARARRRDADACATRRLRAERRTGRDPVGVGGGGP